MVRAHIFVQVTTLKRKLSISQYFAITTVSLQIADLNPYCNSSILNNLYLGQSSVATLHVSVSTHKTSACARELFLDPSIVLSL